MPVDETLALVAEMMRVLSIAARVEADRQREGPMPLLEKLRREGRARRRRPDQDRARLVRAIGIVDRFFPGGGNCYRRVLLESALDRGAAVERVFMGLKHDGGPGSGHAYFAREAAEQPPASSFDVVFEI